MNQPTHFTVNGQHYCVQAKITLLDLLEYFNYTTHLLVVEYNQFICNKKNWKKIILQDNDTIEIVTIVGGG